jgi:cytochrome c553
LRPYLVALLLAAFTAASAQAGVFDDRKAQCTECHGDSGASKTPNVPSLGGQPELFVLYQLVAFREGQRKVPAMNDMMKGMSDDDLRAAAAYVAKLPPPSPPTKTGDPARLARAQALVDKNRCGFCHNPDFFGHDQIPRLRHQREDYLLKALRDYKAETRIGGGAMMSEVLYPLKDADLADLAYYMAYVR